MNAGRSAPRPHEYRVFASILSLYDFSEIFALHMFRLPHPLRSLQIPLLTLPHV